MAEIAARVANPKTGDSGITTVTWTAITEADTTEEVIINGTGPISCALQVTGTFGGATAILQGSNDGATWFTLKDINNSDTGLTAAGILEFSTSVVYLRVSLSGGTSQSVVAVLSCRG